MSNGATTPDRARAAVGLTPAAGSSVSPLEQRIAYVRGLQPALTDAVASGLRPETLIRDAVTAIRNTPKLAECTAQTFAGALMSAAQLGLRPNVPSLGHGWVLPYWSGKRQKLEAQWILGYQGMIELGYKSGLVAKITTDTIYANDHYRVRRGTADELVHEPVLDESDRGDAIAHYAIVWLQTGQPLWRVMPDAEVRRIRDRMGAKDRQGNIVGPWKDDYIAMAQKTPLRALWRFMPKTPMLALALATDSVTREGTDAVVVEPAEVVDQAAADEPPAAGPAADAQPNDQGAQEAAQPFTMANGDVRDPAPAGNRAVQAKRRALLTRIADTHGQRLRATIEQAVGEYIPVTHLTTAELEAVADFTWGDE